MEKYFLGFGDCDLTESNANKECENVEEAVKELKEFKQEILNGVYDAEWCIEPEEREEQAEQAYIFKIEYTKSGSIRKAEKI